MQLLQRLFLGSLFLLLNSSSIWAGNESIIDSLKQIIDSDIHDTIRVDAYNKWDNYIYRTDPELDLEINFKITEICSSNLEKSLGDKEKKYFLNARARAFNNLGIIFKNKGDFETATEYYKQSLKLKQELGDQKGIINSYLNIGTIFHLQGNLVRALDEYYKSLSIAEELIDTISIIRVMNNIGAIYHYQDDFTNALKYYERCLSMGIAYSKGYNYENSYGNIGFVYFEQGDSAQIAGNDSLANQLFDQSLDYYVKALTISEEQESISSISRLYNNMGSVYYKKGQKEKALDYFLKSLKLKQGNNDPQGEASALTNAGNIFYDRKEYPKAIDYGKRAYEKASKSEAIFEINSAANLLYSSYKAAGNSTKALEFHELYLSTKDSIANKESTTQTIQQQFQYEYDKRSTADSIIQAEAIKVKNAEIAAEKAEAEKQKLEVNAQRKQKYYLYGGLSLVALFGLFMFNRFKVTQRQKNIIDQQKTEVESQKAQIEEQHQELEESHKEISDSIKYAERLQLAILPSREDLQTGLKDGFVLFQPKDVVSGDFYWMQKTDDKVLFAAADCTGHGVPGAMVSVVCSNALNRVVKEFGITKPAEILNNTRDLVIETFSRSGKDVKDGMDIALCSLSFQENSLQEPQATLQFAGANNPLWIVREKKYLSQDQLEDRRTVQMDDTALIEYSANKQPVGLYHELNPFSDHTIDLYKGDTIYIFTDGFADQFGGERGKKFKYKPFKAFILGIQDKDMDTQKEMTLRKFNQWKGDYEQVDDVCIIGIRI